MSFFDSKEEVINIELTQHGRYLLSRGKFDPCYYAFYDDDIVYDSNFINITESQNAAQKRILDETPLLKPTYNLMSVEIATRNQIENLKKEDLQALKRFEDSLNRFDFSEYSYLQPLGKSSYNSEFYPAWQLNLIKGTIYDTKPYYQYQYISNLDGASIYEMNMKIPQIIFNTSSYEIYARDNIQDVKANEEILAQIEIETGANKGEMVFLTAAKDKLINIIDLVEKNVDDMQKNFDAEVFIEEEIDIPNIGKKKIWKKLFFFKKPTNIKNNILLDDYIYKEANYTIPDETNVEYYFQFLTDNEIDLPENMKSDNSVYDTINQDKPFGENC